MLPANFSVNHVFSFVFFSSVKSFQLNFPSILILYILQLKIFCAIMFSFHNFLRLCSLTVFNLLLLREERANH